MAPLAAVILGGLLAAANLGAVAAIPSGRATCASPGVGGACLPAGAVTGDEDGALAMLQHTAKATEEKKAGAGAGKRLALHRHRRDDLNVTLVWEQLKASVEMQELEGMIGNATSSETVEKLKNKLDKLQQKFPSAQELEAQFSDVWANVSKAVDVENIQQKLEAAKAAGSAEVAELQKQYEDLAAQMQDFNLSSIQDQAADVWAQLEEAGASLPGLGNLTDVLNEAKDMAQGALGSATDAVSGAWGAVSGMFR